MTDIIQRLSAIPTMQKVEGGYAYADEYINGFFQVDDKIYYFPSATLCEEIPHYLIPIIHTIVDLKSSDLEMDMISKSDAMLETLNEKILEIVTTLNDVKKEIYSEVKTEILSELGNTLSALDGLTDKIETIVNSAVDKKLTDVYTNFDVVVKQLVQDNIKAIENDVKTASHKFKIHEIAMLQETGLKIADIIELRKQNMI